MSLLSIVLPSNRNLKTSMASLESAIIYAEKTGSPLIITDNSGDQEKKRHFQHASPQLTYIDTSGLTALENLLTAMAKVETPWLLPMGDDDEIFALDGVAPFDFSSVPEDVVGIRPVSVTWSLEEGVRAVERFALTDAHADERILALNRAAPNTNNIFYSAFRTDLFRDLYHAINDTHPTRGAYCDWVLTFCFVACGRILHDPATLFRYDLGRWSGKEMLERSKLDLYRQAGLPDVAENYWALLRFIDTHGMLMWKGLPISADERQRALAVNARLTLTAFVRHLEANPRDLPPAAHLYARQIQALSSIDQAYELALPVVDALKPGLGEKYAGFLTAVTA